MSRDITQNAQIELNNVSNDKRALRDVYQFFLSDLEVNSTYDFRLYTLQDVLQLKIKDSFETFATMRLAELPLCEGHDEIGVRSYV